MTSRAKLFFSFAVMTSLLSGVLHAEGYITQVSGDTHYIGRSNTREALKPFVRLKSGSEVQLGAKAKLQVLYLSNGRQENWIGPARFIVEDAESHALDGAPTQAKILPKNVLAMLDKSSTTIGALQNRQGMIRVRSLSSLRTEEVLADYRRMRPQFAEDDITPELYLLGRLDEIKAYDAMSTALEGIRMRLPGNVEAGQLLENYTAVMQQH